MARGNRTAAQTSARRGAIGCHSPISTAPVPRLEEGKTAQAVAGDGEGKEGDRRKYACMYVYVRRQGGGISRCTGSKSDVRSSGGEPDGGRVRSVMDAQLHTDINIDTVNPHLEMYHIHFFCV